MNLVKVIGGLDQPAGHPGGVGVVSVRLEGLGVVGVPLGLGLLPLGRRGHVKQYLRPTFDLSEVVRIEMITIRFETCVNLRTPQPNNIF